MIELGGIIMTKTIGILVGSLRKDSYNKIVANNLQNYCLTALKQNLLKLAIFHFTMKILKWKALFLKLGHVSVTM